MIKGAQKQMIVVRTGNSMYFDEAYFVLRREIKPAKESKNEMLAEANRILRESEMQGGTCKRRSPRGFLLFAAGILAGGALAAVICLLIL